MAIEYKDFLEYTETKKAEHAHEATRKKAIEYLRAETVEAEKLTGDQKWDRFLSRVQPLLTSALKVTASSKEALPYVLNADERLKLQLVHAFNDGKVKAFEEVMNMPSEIKKYYESVKNDA